MIFSAPMWWLVAALALLPWVGPFRGSNRVQNVLRSIAFVLLAAALTRPQFSTDTAAPEHVVVLDASPSVRNADVDLAMLQAQKLAESERTHLVLVGDTVLQDQTSFASVSRISGSDSPSTDLVAALNRAATLIPSSSSGNVTIATDGLLTSPDDARAATGLKARGIAVDTVPLTSKPTAARAVALNWEGDLRIGTSARLRATIVARGGATPSEVTLKSGNKVLASGSYNGGERETVQLQFEPQASGFIEASLQVAANSPMTVTLPIREPWQILYLGDLQEAATARLAEVLGPGFNVSQVDPAKKTEFEKALAIADLVVMDDLAAEKVPRAAEAQIVAAVANQGLGMVMSGGRSAFGSGGWHDHPVEDMLPVELVQKEEKRDPSTSLAIVIDTSGSMSGVRVQLAKEVSRLAMRRLMPHDKVGIVEFFGAKRWAAPLQPASNQIELQRALNRMDAGGGTVILPALEEAFYGLQNVDTRYKHVLVLTDGGVETGDFESLMRRMAAEGINVSTVLCGGGYHSEFLVNIANWGKGRFYNVPNRFNLPEVLLKQPSTSKLPSYRPGVHNVRARGGSGWWGDVDTTAIPVLAGYVETKPRDGSEVLLEAVEGNHPILATWRYGLGRVTTLATEPVGEGTRPWRDWNDYGKALARILERSAADTREPFRFEIEYDGAETILHAIRQRPRTGTDDDPEPIASLITEAGSEPLTFVARSPDRFIAKTTNSASDSSLRLQCGSTITPDRFEPLVAASPMVPEDSVDPAFAMDLTGLADATNGRVLSLDATWQRDMEPRGQRVIALASWLFLAALFVFLTELVYRRTARRHV